MTICMLSGQKLGLMRCDGRRSCCSCRRKCGESSSITNGKLSGGVHVVLYKCIGQRDGDSDDTTTGMEADIDLNNDEEVEHYEMSHEEYFSDVDVDSQEI